MSIYQNDAERQMIVGLALMVADGDREAGPNTARVLAYEVRTLRKELEAANERECKIFTEGTAFLLRAQIDDLIEQVRSMHVEMEGWKEEAGDAEELRATIARVEALARDWRERRLWCADNLEAALKGEADATPV